MSGSSRSTRSVLVVVVVSVAVVASGLWALRVWDAESDTQAAVPEAIEEETVPDAGALVPRSPAEPRAVLPNGEAESPAGPPRAVSPREAAYEAKYDGMPLDLLRMASKSLSADVREIGNTHVMARFDAGLYDVVTTYLLEEHDPENPPMAQGRPGIYSGFRTVEVAKGVMEMRRVELLPEEYPEFYELKEEARFLLLRVHALEQGVGTPPR